MQFGEALKFLHPRNDCELSRTDASGHLRLFQFEESGLVKRNPILVLVIFHDGVIINSPSLCMPSSLSLAESFDIEQTGRVVVTLYEQIAADTRSTVSRTLDHLC
jgi:hypothetical protein